MALLDVNWRPSSSDLRIFAGLLWLFLLGMGAACFYPTLLDTRLLVLIVATTVMLLVGLLFPALLRPIYLGWMVVAFPIGWCVSHLLMAIIFYLIVTPVGLIMRLVGYDPLYRYFDRSASTYWQRRDTSHPEDLERYFRQY